MQQTLWKTKISSVEEKKNDFEKAIQKETDILMEEFKNSISINGNIEPVFQLPSDLINLFRALVVQTGNVDLTLRGDGFQAKLIPEILNFIAIKELSFTSKSIKSEYKAKKYFIWGFEEPENSYEYRNAQILSEKFKHYFSVNAQIFITTHSFNFLSLRGDHISIYRVWKDINTKSSKITKLKFDTRGKIKFDSTSLNSDWNLLQEELGFFYLNEELNLIYEEKQKQLDIIKERASSIHKPIIYSEGFNFKFLERAKMVYANEIDIEIKDCGGKNELQKLFKLFVKTDFNRFKIFFVFDCDANGPFSDCKNSKTNYLIPFIFERNSKNTYEEVQSGIENLFSNEVFEQKSEIELFDVTEIKRNGIIVSRTRKLRKDNFETYILNERNLDSDFENFQVFFKMVRIKLEEPTKE